jgi:hypothetical protein
MLTVTLLLLIAAFICCIADALGKCPSWVWGLIVIIALLLHEIPIGR